MVCIENCFLFITELDTNFVEFPINIQLSEVADLLKLSN